MSGRLLAEKFGKVLGAGLIAAEGDGECMQAQKIFVRDSVENSRVMQYTEVFLCGKR